MPKTAIALVYNPAAGGGPIDTEQVAQLLGEGYALESFATTPEVDAEACARRAVEQGTQLVIAAGGDGTVSGVASALVDSPATLAVIPRGTANSFAAALGIPAALDLAVETVRNGVTEWVDTARANGRPMILHAAAGFHAAVVGGTSSAAKGNWGMLAYLATALERLSEASDFFVHIESDTHCFDCRASNVMVASLAPPHTLLAQGPSLLLPNDNTLDVTLVAARGFADVVATGLHLMRAANQEQAATRENIGYFPCRRVRITTDPAQPLLVDGESAGEGELVVECLPRTLRVKVPADAAWRTKSANPDTKLEGLPELRRR
jgi:YegS/Rv2252/BmrU family lipid kinase